MGKEAVNFRSVVRFRLMSSSINKIWTKTFSTSELVITINGCFFFSKTWTILYWNAPWRVKMGTLLRFFRRYYPPVRADVVSLSLSFLISPGSVVFIFLMLSFSRRGPSVTETSFSMWRHDFRLVSTRNCGCQNSSLVWLISQWKMGSSE